MLDLFLDYIEKQKLFHREQKILLAISGGIDSMVLLHLFGQTDYRYGIAHCNFQLREKESDEDQRSVEHISKRFQVPLFLKTFRTKEHATKHGISIQMAARELRRTWFRELLEKEGYHLIATGHHLNDALETVLFNLAKGTGISGIKGISPKRGIYIRPLMFATREKIEDYASKHNISWREDSSNYSVKYQRNLIRHNIIPELKKINPRLEENFAISAERISAAENIYRNIIRQQKETLLEQSTGGQRIDKNRLKSIDEPVLILYELLKKFGFNYLQVKDIFSAIDHQPGKRFESHAHELVIDRGYLFISEKSTGDSIEIQVEQSTSEIDVNGKPLTFAKVEPASIEFAVDNTIVYVDYSKLVFPLTIRNWAAGDRFQPLGMKHKKKLSDFMIDEKIPLNLKKQVMVLTSGGELVWVIGFRIDDRYKITGKTSIAYKISYTNGDD